MSELILHIGAHKTATTTIQKLLAESAGALARANVVYPRIAWFQFAQHRLAFGLKRMTDPTARDVPDPLAEIAGINAVLAANRGKRVLVSSEELFTMPAASLELLKGNLVADSIRIVACVRRPDDMLLSIYNQKAKTPNNGFARMLDHFVANPRLIDPDIAYGQQLGKWIDAFGASALSVYTYEESPPVASFFAQLGMVVPQGGASAFNPSVPGTVVELMRMAKAFGMAADRQPRLYAAALRQFADAPLRTLPDEARRSIVATMQPECDALFQRLGRANPYTVDRLVPARADAAAAPAPSVSYRDLMSLVESLLPPS